MPDRVSVEELPFGFGMMANRLDYLSSQVEASSFLLQCLDNPDAVTAVMKACVQHFIEHRFADVAKRRMPKGRDLEQAALDKIFVQVQGACDRAAHLRYFDQRGSAGS